MSDYHAEKAAAAARTAARMAEAAAEFTAWYQDVGTRAERSTKGRAGANYQKHIATSPLCPCGRATRANGLCAKHNMQAWRASHGRRRYTIQIPRRGMTLEAVCGLAVIVTLDFAHGNKKLAAERLGISRPALYAWIRRLQGNTPETKRRQRPVPHHSTGRLGGSTGNEALSSRSRAVGA